MWISKEEYNQLKTERDYYEQQLKNWEQEWKNAYVKTNPIDGKDHYKTTSDLENMEIKVPDWMVNQLKSGYFMEPVLSTGYMEERDWLNLVNRYDKELNSKNEDIEDLERCISEYEKELDRKNELVEELQKEVTRLQKQEIEMNNYKQQFKPILDSHNRLENYVSELKKDLMDTENSLSEVHKHLDLEAKRNNELFKLNNRLCDKILELEKENNPYFLESEIKQLIDLLDVALRDMNLHSNSTLYELEYDSKVHIYRIVTTPKTK